MNPNDHGNEIEDGDEQEEIDADTARELLDDHTHEPEEDDVEFIHDMPRPPRPQCTRAELEEVAADVTANPLERQAARDALARGDFLP